MSIESSWPGQEDGSSIIDIPNFEKASDGSRLVLLDNLINEAYSKAFLGIPTP